MYQLDEKSSSARPPPFQRTVTKLGAKNSKFGVVRPTGGVASVFVFCIQIFLTLFISFLYIWVMRAIFEIQQNQFAIASQFRADIFVGSFHCLVFSSLRFISLHILFPLPNPYLYP